MKNLYSYNAFIKYFTSLENIDSDVIEGCLIDTVIIYHSSGTIEVFEETALNTWQSAYARHIYKSGKLPKRFKAALEEQAEEIAYYEALQAGTYDTLNAYM